MDYRGKREQQVNNNIINPIHVVDKNKAINPLVVLEDHPNDKNRFAILSSTENGKYVRGGMLVFNFKGLEIYTELKNVIFVDLINNTIFIKEYDKVQEEIAPVNPEERQYIIFMKCIDDDEYFIWESMTGRTTAYNFIVDNIDELGIEPEESFVLTENVPYKDALSVANFVRYLKNAEYVPLNDGFDIEEYI